MNRNRIPSLPSSSRKKNKDSQETNLILTALKNSSWGLIASIGLGLLLITISTIIAYSNPDPDSLVTPLGLASMAVSAFIGGFVNGKLTENQPFLCGTINGLWLVMLFILTSFLTSSVASSHYYLWQVLLLNMAVVAISVIGAFIGARKKKTKPGKHKRTRYK